MRKRSRVRRRPAVPPAEHVIVQVLKALPPLIAALALALRR
jgi:hypothetical protein